MKGAPALRKMTSAHALSWATVMRAIADVTDLVKTSGFKPDYLVGITTGGLIPLGILSKNLQIRNVLTVSAHSYKKGKKNELVVTYRPRITLRDKKILLIDEIAETGDTLYQISQMMRAKYRVKDCKTLTIALNESKCRQYPDYWILATHADLTIFPWEEADFPDYF